MSRHIPQLVAHRGYMSAYPENTKLSICQAIEHGARYVEFDVQCSKDGTLVVIHDDTLQRTTERNDSVFALTCKQLQTISAHYPERFGSHFRGECLINLEQMMTAIDEAGDCHAFVEVKHESLLHFGHQAIMSNLLATLKPYQQQSTIISFDQQAIAIATKHGFKTGWVLHRYNQQHLDLAIQLHPDYLICNYQKITTPQPWPGTWQWMLYDITDPKLALEYAQRGFDFIETEAIAEMLQSDDFIRQPD